jgi:hypothetical protein
MPYQRGQLAIVHHTRKTIGRHGLAAPSAVPAPYTPSATATYCSPGLLHNYPPWSSAFSFAMPRPYPRDCSSSIPGLCGSPPPVRRALPWRRAAKSKRPTSHKLLPVWVTRRTTTNYAIES